MLGGKSSRVVAGFFCDDNISFTLVTDSAPGGQGRTYPSFSAAETEAGRSRVVGGIHFELAIRLALPLVMVWHPRFYLMHFF